MLFANFRDYGPSLDPGSYGACPSGSVLNPSTGGCDYPMGPDIAPDQYGDCPAGSVKNSEGGCDFPPTGTSSTSADGSGSWWNWLTSWVPGTTAPQTTTPGPTGILTPAPKPTNYWPYVAAGAGVLGLVLVVAVARK